MNVVSSTQILIGSKCLDSLALVCFLVWSDLSNPSRQNTVITMYLLAIMINHTVYKSAPQIKLYTHGKTNEQINCKTNKNIKRVKPKECFTKKNPPRQNKTKQNNQMSKNNGTQSQETIRFYFRQSWSDDRDNWKKCIS